MADDHLLYFLANRGLYREGKIDVLSAQSSILKSREIIKKLIELKESEKKYKTRIAKNLSKTKT